MREPFSFVKLGRGAGRRDAEGVDADDFLRVRIVDEGLRLAAPGERVPHGAVRGDHGRGGIDGVAALLKNDGAGGGAERLAGDSHPVRAVQRRLLRAHQRLLCGRRGGEESEKKSGARFHRRVLKHPGSTGVSPAGLAGSVLTAGKTPGSAGVSPARLRGCCLTAGETPALPGDYGATSINSKLPGTTGGRGRGFFSVGAG